MKRKTNIKKFYNVRLVEHKYSNDKRVSSINHNDLLSFNHSAIHYYWNKRMMDGEQLTYDIKNKT